MAKVVGSMHLCVRFERTMKVRLWIASQVIRLAAWIAGCGVSIETGDAEAPA